jgi:Tol biopolymer transport system component
MNIHRVTPAVAAALLIASSLAAQQHATAIASRADEPHLANIRQLTFGGENAEAYFSSDGTRLIFQSTRPGGRPCDEIYTMRLDGTDIRRVSTGTGRTTCGYFYPTAGAPRRLLYASTHAADTACPPRPDMRNGYVWALYEYDIWSADADGGHPRRLTSTPGYDAEGTISPDGRTIVFTSMRAGDLELYAMDASGRNVRRLTHEAGYDGGAFFSPDGKRIVYRASHPSTDSATADYRRLLRQKLVRPTTLELWVMDADGRNKRQVTRLDAASFAPFFHPDGRRIIFSSNRGDPQGREFDLYMVNDDGSGLQRITRSPEFDGFPMFTADGKQLVFASNRNSAHRGDTNIFIADWVDAPPAPSTATRR